MKSELPKNHRLKDTPAGNAVDNFLKCKLFRRWQDD